MLRYIHAKNHKKKKKNLLFNAETAVLLLKLDKSLSKLTGSGGGTCLGLLTEIPSSFKSGHSMSIFSRFLYICML